MFVLNLFITYAIVCLVLVMQTRDRIGSNIRLARRGAVFVLNLFITYAVICPGLVMQARDRIVSKIRLARRGAIL